MASRGKQGRKMHHIHHGFDVGMHRVEDDEIVWGMFRCAADGVFGLRIVDDFDCFDFLEYPAPVSALGMGIVVDDYNGFGMEEMME